MISEQRSSVSDSSALVATLGGQPQVVTFALDALLAQGADIRDVFVVHPAPGGERLQRALVRLDAEFSGGVYQGRTCRLRRVGIGSPAGPLEDLRSEADADAAWLAMHDLLGTLKAQGRHVHLCIAGGRWLMGLLALSVAMLHFGHHDRTWHLYTPDELRKRADEGAVMHAGPADDVRLVQVPLAPWGAYFPGLRALLATSPSQVIAAQMNVLDEADRRRCRAVLAELTPRQKDVLWALAEGATPLEAATKLSVQLSTIDSHKSAILAECRLAWGWIENHWLDYRFLREKFGRCLDLKDGL